MDVEHKPITTEPTLLPDDESEPERYRAWNQRYRRRCRRSAMTRITRATNELARVGGPGHVALNAFLQGEFAEARRKLRILVHQAH
jgi:hypothetical protein